MGAFEQAIAEDVICKQWPPELWSTCFESLRHCINTFDRSRGISFQQYFVAKTRFYIVDQKRNRALPEHVGWRLMGPRRTRQSTEKIRIVMSIWHEDMLPRKDRSSQAVARRRLDEIGEVLTTDQRALVQMLAEGRTRVEAGMALGLKTQVAENGRLQCPGVHQMMSDIRKRVKMFL